jgi:hypothetical protein
MWAQKGGYAKQKIVKQNNINKNKKGTDLGGSMPL